VAFKTFELTDDTSVTIFKRKGSRSLRLSVTAKGEVRVSIPTWTPYAAGLAFAKSRASWIAQQQRPTGALIHGQAIGKAHHLSLLPAPGAQKVTTRVLSSGIFIKYPAHLAPTSQAVQTTAEKACIRALRLQAEQLLPQRLATLAEKHDFTYKDVSIKQLKSRWGSCDQDKHIVLNLFLMQLPWELIDYVLLHELTHTKHMHHGPDFWEQMKLLTPYATERRRSMKRYSPSITIMTTD
jgi:predicted metal-dependent hydrolase